MQFQKTWKDPYWTIVGSLLCSSMIDTRIIQATKAACPSSHDIGALSLREKIALVTGSSRGIGASTAVKLAGAGATVIINFENAESYNDALEVSRVIGDRGGQAHIIRADVSSSIEVKNMMTEIVKQFQRLDILINNAGVNLDHSIENMSESEWDRV